MSVMIKSRVTLIFRYFHCSIHNIPEKIHYECYLYIYNTSQFFLYCSLILFIFISTNGYMEINIVISRGHNLENIFYFFVRTFLFLIFVYCNESFELYDTCQVFLLLLFVIVVSKLKISFCLFRSIESGVHTNINK